MEGGKIVSIPLGMELLDVVTTGTAECPALGVLEALKNTSTYTTNRVIYIASVL